MQTLLFLSFRKTEKGSWKFDGGGCRLYLATHTVHCEKLTSLLPFSLREGVLKKGMGRVCSLNYKRKLYTFESITLDKLPVTSYIRRCPRYLSFQNPHLATRASYNTSKELYDE
jgi:hypothetical protein